MKINDLTSAEIGELANAHSNGDSEFIDEFWTEILHNFDMNIEEMRDSLLDEMCDGRRHAKMFLQTLHGYEERLLSGSL